MEKNIVEVVSNNKGEVTEKVADYIGVETFAKEIESLYRECLDEFDNKEEFEQYIDDLYGRNGMVHRFAVEFSYEANKDMKKYLHMDSHRMDGNFANIEDDYPKYRTGTCWPSEYDGDDYYDLFPEMVKRLDAAEDSERANDDREYLSSWFFSAFGTYNIKYNFSSDLDELYDEFEGDKEDWSISKKA